MVKGILGPNILLGPELKKHGWITKIWGVPVVQGALGSAGIPWCFKWMYYFLCVTALELIVSTLSAYAWK